MPGAILSRAILSRAGLAMAVATAAATLAQAETPTIRSFRPPSPSRVAIPVMARPVASRPVAMAARTPHCPKPPIKPPLTVSTPKPDYNRRTMRLVQQNIAMMAAMRAAQAPRVCDPSWSARKLARRGCPPAPRPSELVLELPSSPPLDAGTVVATTPEASVGQN